MIAIPNMEKPKKCRTCNFKSNKEGECWFVHDENDCQLIDIVQCKDCKHYDTESRSFPCCTDMFGAVRYMEPDGFCSKGERRSK